MPKWKVGIWGQFGDGGKIADGQAVRTTLITRELQKRYGVNSIGIVNTNGWRKNPLKILVKSLNLIVLSEKIIVLPADNGFKVFVPILTSLNYIFHRELIYVVIGGFLPALLHKIPKYIKYVNRFTALFVQTENIKRDLEAIGIKRVQILSNFKHLNTRKVEDIQLTTSEQVKVCVFSRITKEKGIEDAITAVRLANHSLGAQRITIDFYGLISSSYEKTFEKLLSENKSIAKYKGIVDFDKTVDTLQQYFAMLFPTYYHGEGFPGNVVDAYNAGIPIIATDWLYNKDVIRDGRNGILVPIQNPQKLSEALLKLYHDRELARIISLNNLEEAKKYQPDIVLKDLYELLEK